MQGKVVKKLQEGRNVTKYGSDIVTASDHVRYALYKSTFYLLTYLLTY